MHVLLGSDLIFKGRQFWDPENSTARCAVTLINLHDLLDSFDRKMDRHAGHQHAGDMVYNAEWRVSGGFAEPATPRVIRVDVRYNF